VVGKIKRKQRSGGAETQGKGVIWPRLIEWAWAARVRCSWCGRGGVLRPHENYIAERGWPSRYASFSDRLLVYDTESHCLSHVCNGVVVIAPVTGSGNEASSGLSHCPTLDRSIRQVWARPLDPLPSAIFRYCIKVHSSTKRSSFLIVQGRGSIEGRIGFSLASETVFALTYRATVIRCKGGGHVMMMMMMMGI